MLTFPMILQHEASWRWRWRYQWNMRWMHEGNKKKKRCPTNTCTQTHTHKHVGKHSFFYKHLLHRASKQEHVHLHIALSRPHKLSCAQAAMWKTLLIVFLSQSGAQSRRWGELNGGRSAYMWQLTGEPHAKVRPSTALWGRPALRRAGNTAFFRSL